MTVTENQFENLRLELRRGSLTLAGCWLSSAVSITAIRCARLWWSAGLEIEESTLYPLLRRLESQGLLVASGARKISAGSGSTELSAAVARVFAQLLQEWQTINSSIEKDSVRTKEEVMELLDRLILKLFASCCRGSGRTIFLPSCASTWRRNWRTGRRNWGVR